MVRERQRLNSSTTNTVKATVHGSTHLTETVAELSQTVAQLQVRIEQLNQEVESLKEENRTLREEQQALHQSVHQPINAPSSPQPHSRTTTPIPSEVPTAPPSLAKPKQKAALQVGLWFVLLSTLALSIHNVTVKLILGDSINLFGLAPFGGFIQPSLGNSLLILWTRMLVVVPLMAFSAGILYPPVWKEIQRLVLARDRRPLFNVIGSGICLFLSQVLIYIAIAQIGPGTAVTILFMYPLLTVPLAWWLFGDRPTLLRLSVMLLILSGIILTAVPTLGSTGLTLSEGVVTAALSGVAFAFYLIFMQLGFKKMHPVPVSLVQFVTILFLSSLSLALPIHLGVEVAPENREGFLLGSLVLGALTLFGYLSNNFGVRYMGAARASIVASSSPVITVVLAAIMLQMQLTEIQVFGVLLVTIGVIGLSFERMRKMTIAPKPSK